MTQVDVGGVITAPQRRWRRVPGPLAWIAVAPCAVWALVRLAGVDGPVLTELITATPYVAGFSLFALLLALGSRRRVVAAVAAASSTLMAFMVLPRAFGDTPTATGPSLRILTINLFVGRGDAHTVVDLVRRLRPDVLNTQELEPRAVEALDAAGLGTLMPYSHLEPAYGASGSGIYSRYPLTKLPDFAPSSGHRMPYARFTLPSGQAVELVDVHTMAPLGPDVATWEEGLRSLPPAVPGVVRVLAGDFNASLDHGSLRDVLGRGYLDAADATGAGLRTTWPANRRFPPLITIDHVLVDQRASAVDVNVHDVPGTDHRAVFAELRLPTTL
ncbi:endonuclease/exonuclease/phosphatase family protein [Microtetraspora sp. NBRC 16547]|uniref:endonuclease/exonuclease/phosphatase family protein n=1 Tax=Microtetraspora sp. NBRC 16547 TaxID=3030993 RepID=UPI0024A4BFA3|nr:endonuclease/exonuclease/phosphatase family protein [Microtetraspora sp. NBRC 16547]GLW97800.1 endonuclease [Microtetraspora sp. NBRC 16547]